MTTPMAETDAKVTRLFGGPGSGKTTELLDRVEDILAQDGVTVKDLLVVSYTRAAANEVRERLAERLDVDPRSLQGNVCTMHAKAYELLNLSRGDVVGEKQKEEFCKNFGLEYEDEYSGSGRRTARSTTLGNKIIATSQWLQRTSREVADWYDVPFQWDVEEVRLPPDIDPNAQEGNKYTPTWPSSDDRFDVPEAIRGWRKHKGDEGLVGFADMLERVKQRSLLPNVDYLIIDEFQDITKLQYDIYEEWKPHVKNVLIAGDDDQVVYAWQGADPKLLLEEGGEDVILDTSYRLPSRVLKVVQKEVSHIEERQEKNLKPRKEGGTVEAVESPSMLDLVRNVRDTIEDFDGTVMVLFRARYQMFRFVDEFIGEGIPFRTLTDQRMWTDRLNQYVDAVEQIEDGRTHRWPAGPTPRGYADRIHLWHERPRRDVRCHRRAKGSGRRGRPHRTGVRRRLREELRAVHARPQIRIRHGQQGDELPEAVHEGLLQRTVSGYVTATGFVSVPSTARKVVRPTTCSSAPT